jgi:hypothetical protein
MKPPEGYRQASTYETNLREVGTGGQWPQEMCGLGLLDSIIHAENWIRILGIGREEWLFLHNNIKPPEGYRQAFSYETNLREVGTVVRLARKLFLRMKSDVDG